MSIKRLSSRQYCDDKRFSGGSVPQSEILDQDAKPVASHVQCVFKKPQTLSPKYTQAIVVC